MPRLTKKIKAFFQVQIGSDFKHGHTNKNILPIVESISIH